MGQVDFHLRSPELSRSLLEAVVWKPCFPLWGDRSPGAEGRSWNCGHPQMRITMVWREQTASRDAQGQVDILWEDRARLFFLPASPSEMPLEAHKGGCTGQRSSFSESQRRCSAPGIPLPESSRYSAAPQTSPGPWSSLYLGICQMMQAGSPTAAVGLLPHFPSLSQDRSIDWRRPRKIEWSCGCCFCSIELPSSPCNPHLLPVDPSEPLKLGSGSV